ncbi:MAG: SCO family protein [Lewinellaceae bacterium]|nr:SCO family protein [Phaeodactylibacter sp.]MCB0613616.1 SCO family protein [Phaeodactylibacter sp.]MCB9346040.1 SCO family protein [Lewinellaceae bacterium]
MRYWIIASLALSAFACNNSEPPQKALPIIGNHDIQGKDTIYHQIPDFAFIDQDSQVVTNATFDGKIYVADFFFTSCPTICPKVKKQMLRIYDKYKDEPRLMFLSHSIDPKRDTVGRLKTYSENLGVDTERWRFVTGNKDEIYEIADDYMSIALEDPTAPGGFDHSGWILLIDKDRHIRSYCNGTVPEKVDEFMKDVDWLLGHM